MRKALAVLTAIAMVLGTMVPVQSALASASGAAHDMAQDGAEDEREYLDGFPIWEELVAQGSGTSSRYLAATGEHCHVYVDGGNPSQEDIDDLVYEFDNVIWPIDTAVFGEVSRDRIDIHLDTIDGPYGIGGYYIPGTWSIYIDVSDLNIWGYQIAAHEFQHLIHDKHDSNEELWLNEAMSDLAIHLIYGPDASAVTGHLNSFEDNPDNDLTVFENQMYDYGSAYAFALYLWEHFGGNDTIRSIVDNAANGFQGVLEVLALVDANYTYTDIELFSMWSVANLIDDPKVYDGIYGYESVDLSMYIEGVVDSYPSTQQSSVESWGSDYYTFKEGEKKDLVVEVSRIDGSFNATLVGIGSAGTLARSALVTANEPLKEIYIPHFGSHYMVAYLIISGWDGERYKFTAEFKDNTPPVTVVAVNPGSPDGLNGYYVTEPTIGFITSEPADTFFWWDDGDEETYCPDCTPATVPIAPQGNHTLQFYSMDPDGNREEEVRSRTFLVDTSTPETYANLTPAQPDGEGGWYVTNVSVELTSEEDAVIYYRWDSGFYHDYAGAFFALEGQHRIYFYSMDLAGNEGEVHIRDIKVDTATPSLSMEVYPPMADGKNGWYITQPTVAVTVNEADAYVYYSVDDASTIVYGQPFKVPQGMHTVRVWARDTAGNEGDVSSMEFWVDSVAPKTRLDMTPSDPDGSNGWYVTVPTIRFDTDKDASVHYRFEDGPERKFTGTVLVEEGVHDLYYWSKDKAGNVEPENRLQVKVDTEAPETEIIVKGMETYGWYLDPPLIDFDVSEDGTVHYRWDGGIETKFTVPITAKDGTHELSYYAMDLAGNREEVATGTFQVDASDPSPFFTVVPTFAYVGDEIVFDASDSIDNTGIVSYEFTFGDGGVERQNHDPRFAHTFQLDGSFMVTLTVTDEAGRTASYSKEVYIEKVDEPSDDGFKLTTEMLLLGGIVLLMILAAVGVAAASRQRRRKALAQYVEIYEARLAAEQERRRRARARARARSRAKAGKGKVAKGRKKKVVKRKGPG